MDIDEPAVQRDIAPRDPRRDGRVSAQVRNRLLHELFEDQVNIVNFKYDGKQTGTMFNVQDGFKVVPDKK